jgi:DNA-binding MurR/RpiR family transcriptional regulator
MDEEARGRGDSAIGLINRHYGGLSPGYRRVADHILASPHEAALMTLEELAARSGVSIATANRFARKIGLDGYPELKRLMRDGLQQALRPVEELIATIRVASLSPSAPWTRSLEADLKQISEVETIGGDQAFACAANLLAAARRAFLIGFGSSSFIAGYAAFNLSSLRDGVEAVNDASGVEGAQRRMLSASPEDVALIIGFARYSAPAVELAQQLARRKVPLIAVTDGTDSPFARVATVTICVQRKQGFVLSGAGAGGLAIIDALFHGAAATIGADVVERRFARLTSALGGTIVAPAMSETDDRPAGS